MFDWIEKQWMRVMKYEGECIENIQRVKSYEYHNQLEKTDVSLLLPMVFDWSKKIYQAEWSMKVSASKIWNESNCAKITLS